jgi:formyltetrahydrofolate hydrolase
VSKVCILTWETNPIAAELFYAIYDIYEVNVIYVAQRKYSFKEILRRKRGLRWFWFNIIFSRAQKIFDVGHTPYPDWKELVDTYPDSFLKVSSHNSSDMVSILQQSKFELGVLIGTELISPRIYQIPQLGMINLHQGSIPNYRGAPPAFWEHLNRETEMSITIHTVVRQFDAGRIIEEEKISIEDHQHFVVSKFCANLISAKLLASSIGKRLELVSGQSRSITTKLNTVPSYSILFCETVRLFQFAIKKQC